MGNTPRRPSKTVDKIHWEFHKKETNQWEKFDRVINSIIESNFIMGKKKIIFHNEGIMVDLVSNEMKMTHPITGEQTSGDSGQPIRRRIIWNLDEINQINPQIDNNNPDNLENHQNNHKNPSDDEPGDLADYIAGLTRERDNYITETTRLKKQIHEMTVSLTEAIEARDMALITNTEVLEVLKYKNEEVKRMQELEQDLTETKEKLESKNNEAKTLNILNSELRIKLTQELTELGKNLEPKLAETESLKNRVKTLQTDLKTKERELEYIRSNPNTPTISPRNVSTITTTPEESQTRTPPLRSISQRGASKSVSKKLPSKASPIDDIPRTRATSKSLSRNSIPGLNLSLNVNNAPSDRRRRTSKDHTTEYQPRISMLNSATTTPREPAEQPANRSSDVISRSARPSFSSQRVPSEPTNWRQREDAKEKLLKAENRCKSIEGELEIEKLKVSNLKKDLTGRDLEIELLRNQKVSLKDQLNEQIASNNLISQKLQNKADKIYKLEAKLVKLKGKMRTSPEQGSESYNTDDTEESQIPDEAQEDIKQLEEKLEKARLEYEVLQDANNKLQETVSILVEKISSSDKRIAELEFSLSQAKIDVEDKDKEILTLKASLKENGSKNPRLFKVMAEELQSEKAKALTLNNEVKRLSTEIKSLKENNHLARHQSLPYPHHPLNRPSEESLSLDDSLSPDDKKSQVLKSTSLQQQRRRKRNFYPESGYIDEENSGSNSSLQNEILFSDNQNDTQQIDTGELSE